jgi:hypothetical protein
MYSEILPDIGPDPEWDRELADPYHDAPGLPWPGQPLRCTCTRMVVATLEETLGCPFGWRYVPGTGWAHPRPARWAS